jgi:branched-chain amino acid aminotransferase
MRSDNYAYVNGRFLPENEASVSIFDRGFLYGDGVFETMRIYSGKIFRLAQHLQRMAYGLESLRLDCAVEITQVEAIFDALLERNKLKDGVARICVTSGPTGSDRSSAERPTLVATAQPLDPARTPASLRAMTATIRLDEDSVFAGVKTSNRLPYIVARTQATQAGYDEALLLNEHSHICEFSVSNIFVVKTGELWTPPLTDGPLPGVTRDVVIMLAAKLGITCYEMSFGLDALADADEVFATNSLIEVTPVRELDERKFTSTKVTGQFADAYRQLVREELRLA